MSHDLLQDLRSAVRTLRRSPFTFVTAVATLALGIGAATAVFTEINAFHLRPLNVTDPERLVSLSWESARGARSSRFLEHEFFELQNAAEGVLQLAAYLPGAVGVSRQGTAEIVYARYVTPNYFQFLGAKPALGRFFAPGGGGEGEGVVLSHAVWQRRLGSDARILGSVIHLNGQPLTVIGVAPAQFNGVSRAVGEDLWIPLQAYDRLNPAPVRVLASFPMLEVLGRLRQGIDRQAAAEVMSARVGQTDIARGKKPGDHLVLSPLDGLPTVEQAPGFGPSTLYLAASMLMLLIASVNVAGILLTRAVTRQKEIAIRLALGIGRFRLVRQLLVESVLLFLAAAAVGVLLSVLYGQIRSVTVWPPVSLRTTLDYGLDVRVLGFALGVALLTSVLCSIAPAAWAWRTDVMTLVKESVSSGRPAARFRALFVVVQIALSLVLLVWAHLFLTGLRRAATSDPGFQTRGIVTATVDLHALGYSVSEATRFFDALQQRLRARERISGVALTSSLPLSNTVGRMTVWTEPEQTGQPGNVRNVQTTTISEEYFRILDIPLLRGRAFMRTDGMGSGAVGIINGQAARRWWPGEDPLGKQITTGVGEITIVGVARDAQTGRLGEAPEPHLYLPLSQYPASRLSLMVQTSGEVTHALRTLRDEIGTLRSDVPVIGAMPLHDAISGSLAGQRNAAARLALFGTLGLVLTAVGLYGVLAYLVVSRTREIGVRLALGARERDVLLLVLRQGLRLAALGIVLGLLAYAAATPWLASYAYGSNTSDLTIIGVAVAVLTSVAALASYIPARRATHVQPYEVLRRE